MNKLFSDLDISQFDKGDVQNSFEKDFKLPQLYLTFRYTPKRKLVFYYLSVKANGKRKDLLGKDAIKDSDGNQTFFIGEFKKGEEVEISYGVMPITKVPKAIVLIGQTSPQKAYQVEPTTTGKTKLLERGVKWENTVKYKIQ